MTKSTRKSKKTFGFDEVPGGYVDPIEEWDREHLPALRIAPGDFEAWIGVTDNPPGRGLRGPSVCAWQIRRRDAADPEKPEVWPGRPVHSDESKAYLAAVAGILDQLPLQSTVVVYCRASWIVDALNGDLDKWAGLDELREGKRKYYKVWKHVLERRNQIAASPGDIKGSRPDQEHDKIIQELVDLARTKRPKLRG